MIAASRVVLPDPVGPVISTRPCSNTRLARRAGGTSSAASGGGVVAMVRTVISTPRSRPARTAVMFTR